MLEETSILNVLSCGSQESLDGCISFDMHKLNLRNKITLHRAVYHVKSHVPDNLF